VSAALAAGHVGGGGGGHLQIEVDARGGSHVVPLEDTPQAAEALVEETTAAPLVEASVPAADRAAVPQGTAAVLASQQPAPAATDAATPDTAAVLAAKEVALAATDAATPDSGAVLATQDATRVGYNGTKQIPLPLPEVPLIRDALSPTGAVRENDPAFDRQMIRRLRAQDLAVLAMLGVIYFVTIAFGLAVVYRASRHTSNVKYFCDPRFHLLTSTTNDPVPFLSIFNQRPSFVTLQVSGFTPSLTMDRRAVSWRGGRYLNDFNFALDLSSFVSLDGTVAAGDHEVLQQFLHCTNALESCEIQKDVEWSAFDEVAERIRARFREQGFRGVVDVQLNGKDRVHVLQNKPWSNFMHHRTTRTLAVLSLVGAPFYMFYLWLRCSKNQVQSRFSINASSDEYWALVAPHICSSGFSAPP